MFILAETHSGDTISEISGDTDLENRVFGIILYSLLSLNFVTHTKLGFRVLLYFCVTLLEFSKKNDFNHATKYYIAFSSPLENKCYKHIYQSHID